MDMTKYSDYEAWLEEFEDFRPGAKERLHSAEEAYKDALAILSLTTVENRRYIARIINESESFALEVSENDFEDVTFAPDSREELEELYGIKVFPKTLIVPRKCGKRGLLYKSDRDTTEQGVTVIEVPYPFSCLGGLAIICEDLYSAHEDIHGANEIYRPEGGVEFAILDEVSAARDDVRRNVPMMGTWPKAVKEIMRHSFPAIAEWYEIPPERMNEYAGPLKSSVQTVEYVGRKTPQYVISRAILSAMDIADFSRLRSS